ncbi:MAG TPA: phosphomannomutase, partial [Polyangiales bacterium]
LRVDCPDDVKFGLVQRVLDHYRPTHQVIDVDGARIQFDDGWGLVRASNTQPVLVLRFEAGSAQQLDVIRSEVEGTVARLRG